MPLSDDNLKRQRQLQNLRQHAERRTDDVEVGREDVLRLLHELQVYGRSHRRRERGASGEAAVKVFLEERLRKARNDARAARAVLEQLPELEGEDEYLELLGDPCARGRDLLSD